jgi:hypothetical protein
MSVGHNAKVTVSTQKAYSMECYGSVELKKGSNITASTEAEGADILCYGTIMNYGGAVHGEVEALGSTHDSKES